MAASKSGTGTRGQGTWGGGEVGRLGLGNSGTSGLEDAATHFRSIEFQKWEDIPT